MAFNIHLLRGEDPQAQYDAIAAKDSNTLYLLQSGKGYLGDFMLFNAESNIDFADLQQVKDKLTYKETDDAGEHIYSTIIGYINNGEEACPVNPMTLMPDNGIGVITDEVLRVIDKDTKRLIDNISIATMEPGNEYDDNTYKTVPAILNTVPTMHYMMSYVRDYVNVKLEPYVTATIDDGTATE